MKKRIIKFIISCGCMMFAAWFVFTCILLNAIVPTGSMEPTLPVDGRFIGNRLAYLISEPERYDVVVFRQKDDDTLYVKRIIGLPGDYVEIKEGVVYVNHEEIDSSFIKEDMLVEKDDFWQVPKDSYFVMGDNRNNSDDSRRWKSAYVSKSNIVAKLLFQYVPEFKTIN